MLGDSSERTISAAAIFISAFQYDDLVDLAMPCAREPGAGFNARRRDTPRMALIFARLDFKLAQLRFGKPAQRLLLI